MKFRKWVFFAIILLYPPARVNAQAWSGIISSSRAIDWSKAGVIGGIPNRTTICATLNPGATASQINSAIAACPSGQVVKLNAGTYSLSGGIVFNNKSNVTLRGAGPDQTILAFSAGGGCAGCPLPCRLQTHRGSVPTGARGQVRARYDGSLKRRQSRPGAPGGEGTLRRASS